MVGLRLGICQHLGNTHLTVSKSEEILRLLIVKIYFNHRLVDVFQLQDTVTSLEYSPSGEFLATTLSQELGILLWVNKTMYEHVSLNPLPEDFDPADFLKGIPALFTIICNVSIARPHAMNSFFHRARG